MFNDLPLCCDYSAAATAAASSGVIAKPATGYTINGRTVPFPMVDPYRPVGRARIPVPGYNRFPVPRPLGRHFYGLAGGVSSKGLKGFRGMGYGPDDFEPGPLPCGAGGPCGVDPTILGQGVTLPPSQPSTLQSILNAILPATPAIISAARGNPYYNPAQLVPAQQTAVYGQQPLAAGLTSAGATAGAAVGNLGAAAMQIVEQNPLLILGGAFALFLLFKSPPSRR